MQKHSAFSTDHLTDIDTTTIDNIQNTKQPKTQTY